MEEVEITTPDSLSEEQTLETDSSESTEVVEADNAPEEAEAEASQPEPAPSRAENRIRETIHRAKQAEARAAQLEKELQSIRGNSQPTYDGIDETGIDPQKFAESVMRKADERASQATDKRLEVLRAEQDFPDIKNNRLLQRSAQGYIAEGYSPYEAAQLATEDFNEFRASESQTLAKRQEADSAIRKSTYSPKGTNNSKAGHIFTEAEIASMSTDEYTANHAKIMDQMSKNLIK